MNEVLGFKQNHHQLNKKLFIGTILNAIGLFVTAYSFYVPFQKAKLVIGIFSGLYLIFSSIWNTFVMFIQTVICYQGQSDKMKIKIISRMKLPSSSYNLDIFVNDSAIPTKFSDNVENWFNEDGEFCPKQFVERFSKVMDGVVSKKTK